MKKLLLVLFFFAPLRVSFLQIPIGVVFDIPLAATNTVTLISEQLHRLLLEDEEAFTKSISEVQAFFDKARNIVNPTIKNMQLIRSIWDKQADIIELYEQSLAQINMPINEDPEVSGQGLDDLAFLDKWKHLQILLAFTAEAGGALEIVESLLEDDILSIDHTRQAKRNKGKEIA